MAWATGVSFNGLTWEAHFLEPDGTTSVGPLTRLASDGVAVESGRCRQQIDTDFGTWERVPAADYREALGIASQPDKAVNDVVFQIRHSRGRIVIPALVLIRAFFRPGREFIPELFRPQALSRIGHLADSATGPDIVLYGWNSSHRAKGYGDLKAPLRWLYCFPSAFGMTHSVFEYAKRGTIGLDLPSGSAQMRVEGIERNGVLWSTAVRVSHVWTYEEPYEFAKNVLKTFTFWSPSRRGSQFGDYGSIRRRSDGHLATSPEEWAAIQPILNPRRSTRHDPRLIFDGILTKLDDKTPWAKTHYPVGTYMNAVHAFRKWVTLGTFVPALAELNRLRASDLRSRSHQPAESISAHERQKLARD